MSGPKHRRQLLFFIAAILLPAGVLVGLGIRLILQEGELVEKRASDERRSAREQLRRELTARLEAIQLQEMNRLIRIGESSMQDRQPAGSPVILVAKLDRDRMVLPWELSPRNATPGSGEFEHYRQQGEAEEFIRKNTAGAVEAYRRALASARRPPEQCEARLLLARSLTKAGRAEQSLENYSAMLNACGAQTDQDGIPYSYYAAERLIEARIKTPALAEYLIKQTDVSRWRAPAEVYMLRSLLRSLSGDSADEASRNLAHQIHELEQVLALGRDIHALRARIEAASARNDESIWVAHGHEPWLVTITASAPPLNALAIVVSSQKLAPPGIKLVSQAKNSNDLVGENFPGLNVEWSSNRFTAAGRGIPSSLYMTGLALVLGMTILGGYLLLHDVNRDVRIAEMRSQFVASVSHELKTPLTAIRMFAETLALRRTKDERTNAEYLETIVNESERLARLVDNVLDFSKIEQGKKLYRMQPTSLQHVMQSAARTLQYPLAQQGFRLAVSIDESVPVLPADADAMEQAVLNLLTNAMKYSGEAREIGLRLSRSDGEAVIEVADRGLGIAPDEQSRIFEKFYRVGSRQTALIAGTGLGLTLVAHIAKAHGGRVEVQSEPGQGSTFSIRIPVQSLEARV